MKEKIKEKSYQMIKKLPFEMGGGVSMNIKTIRLSLNGL